MRPILTIAASGILLGSNPGSSMSLVPAGNGYPMVTPLHGEKETAHLAAGPRSSEASPAATTHDPAIGLITLYTSADRLLVMLRVGAAPPIPVVFDTGTNANVLDIGVADRLGLPATGPSEAVDGEGRTVGGRQVALRGASLGGVAIADGAASAIPYDLTDEVGIFGPNSFPGRLVRIEFASHRVSVMERSVTTLPHCASYLYSSAFSFHNKADDTLPTTEVRIGATKIVAAVDTGNNQGLLLPLSYIKKLPLEAPPVPAGVARSAGGAAPVLKARIASDITIAGQTFHRPEVRFLPHHKPNVGLSILRDFTLIFDPTGQRDWLIPANRDPVTCS